MVKVFLETGRMFDAYISMICTFVSRSMAYLLTSDDTVDFVFIGTNSTLYLFISYRYNWEVDS